MLYLVLMNQDSVVNLVLRIIADDSLGGMRVGELRTLIRHVLDSAEDEQEEDTDTTPLDRYII